MSSKLVDKHYDELFKKFDPAGEGNIEQKNFYPMFSELLKLYNDEIESENRQKDQ